MAIWQMRLTRHAGSTSPSDQKPCGFSFWPGFSAHAVDFDRYFLSPTGYRSFLGLHAEPEPGLTPDVFAREIIAAYVTHDLKGRPMPIEARYRDKAA